MQKSEFIAKIKTLAKTVYAEKSNPLADAEEIQDKVVKFPVIEKFPPLKGVMEDLFDFQYEPFVQDIEWVAPRPTTFRIKLVNGADFFLIYQGEDEGKGLTTAANPLGDNFGDNALSATSLATSTLHNLEILG